jgi:glutathione S-transferase
LIRQESQTHRVRCARPERYRLGHVENAAQLSEERVPAWVRRLPKDQPVLIYCYHGNASQTYAQMFSDFRFQSGVQRRWGLRETDGGAGMTKKFYMTPGSCSTGIHILLEECGLVFEAYIVNLLAGDQYKKDYQAINPKGTIPALVLDDGTALTEFSAIAWWLARSYPKRQLLPTVWPAKYVCLAGSTTSCIRCIRRVLPASSRPSAFAPSSCDHESVKAQGRQIIDQGFALINRELAGRDYFRRAFRHRRRGAVLRRILGQSHRHPAARTLCRPLSAHADPSGSASGAGRGRLASPALIGCADLVC